MTYLFMDNETGEEFFVEAPSANEAMFIATKYFPDPVLLDEDIPDWQAEAAGLDTY